MADVLVEIPVAGGGRLVVEADQRDLPGLAGGADMAPASPSPGAIVAKVKGTLEQALDEIRPALAAVGERLSGLGPAEWTVKFGLKVGGETGLVVAKGTAEANIEVSATWKRAH
jgi:hypothetical protein